MSRPRLPAATEARNMISVFVRIYCPSEPASPEWHSDRRLSVAARKRHWHPGSGHRARGGAPGAGTPNQHRERGKDNLADTIVWANARGLRGASLAEALLGILQKQGCRTLPSSGPTTSWKTWSGCSRPSADPRAWVRLIRSDVERLKLPEGAMGVALRVDPDSFSRSRTSTASSTSLCRKSGWRRITQRSCSRAAYWCRDGSSGTARW